MANTTQVGVAHSLSQLCEAPQTTVPRANWLCVAAETAGQWHALNWLCAVAETAGQWRDSTHQVRGVLLQIFLVGRVLRKVKKVTAWELQLKRPHIIIFASGDFLTSVA